MSQDDVLFGYRLQLVDLAGRIGVSAACRVFGVHRSTYYVWKRRIEQSGLGALRGSARISVYLTGSSDGVVTIAA